MKTNADTKKLARRPHWRSLIGIGVAMVGLLVSGWAEGKPSWAPGALDPIMSPGVMAASCSAQRRDNLGNPVAAADAYVYGLMDLRNPSPGDYTTLGVSATMWNAPMWHDSTWSAEQMGCIFGIAVDGEGNTYTAANGLWEPVYSPSNYGDPWLIYGNIGRAGSDELGASGTIYKVDALTGVATVFARVPQVSDPNLPIDPVVGTVRGGPGIGNISVDVVSGNLFATSLDDGRIYQYDPAGVLLGTFDPFTVEASPTPGMIPLGERLWAIEVHAGKVYFAVWNGGAVGSENEIWSVSLTGGVIDAASLAQEMVVPASYGANATDSVTVSDLSFSSDGLTMLIGERCLRRAGANGALPDYYAPKNHTTAARRAEFVSGAWILTGEVATGNSVPSGESYGGIEFGFEGADSEAVVWMSSADIATGAGPHGLQGMRMADFPVPSAPPAQVDDSYVVPYLPGTGPKGPDFKGMGGDVDTMKIDESCVTIAVKEVECPKTPGDPFVVTLSVTNNQAQAISAYGAVATPGSALPSGAVGVQPLPMGWQGLSPVLSQGDSASISLTLPGLSGGEVACFNLTFLDPKFSECCTETVCVDLPVCECALIEDLKVECRQLADGTWVYDLSMSVENTTNLVGSPFAIHGISFGPNFGAFSPNYIDLSSSPLAPGNSQVIGTTYTGSSGLLCFTIVLHNEGNEECCFVEDVCVELPVCGEGPVADCCFLTPERTFCCPLGVEGLVGRDGAVVRYTICNKSEEERLYEWKVENLGPGGVDFFQQVPGGGVVPVTGGSLGPIPAGECLSFELILVCEMEVGECANYAISASAGAGLPELVCRAQICRRDPTLPWVKAIEGEDDVVLAERLVSYGYEVSNPTEEDMRVPVVISSSYGAVGISLNPRERGLSAVRTVVEVPARSKAKLSVFLSRLDGGRVLPTDAVRLLAQTDLLSESQTPESITLVRLVRRVKSPLKVKSLWCVFEGEKEFVRIGLALEAGPVRVGVETLNVETGEWQRVEVMTTAETEGAMEVTVTDENKVLLTPQMNQARGIFRVVYLGSVGE